MNENFFNDYGTTKAPGYKSFVYSAINYFKNGGKVNPQPEPEFNPSNVHIEFVSAMDDPNHVAIIQRSEIPDGYTPLKLNAISVADYPIVDEFNKTDAPELGGAVWYGYNIANFNIGAPDNIDQYAYFTLLTRYPDGSEEWVEIPTTNVHINESQEPDSKVIFNLHDNIPNGNVDLYFRNLDMENSGFAPSRLTQNGEIIVDGFTFDDTYDSEDEDEVHYYGTQLKSVIARDSEDFSEPELELSENITVVQSEYEPGGDPQYVEPTLYLDANESEAVLLLEDPLINHFSISYAYQIIDGTRNPIASDFYYRELFIYDGYINNEYQNETSTDIITMKCYDLEGEIPDVTENYPYFYCPIDSTTGDTVTIKFRGIIADMHDLFTPGKLYMTDGETETTLVSASNWTSIGFDAYEATLENNSYGIDSQDVILQLLVYGEYQGRNTECIVKDSAYTPPTPNRCYIGTSQEVGTSVALLLGEQFHYRHHNVNLGYLEPQTLNDSDETTIVSSFRNGEEEYIFYGNMVATVSDTSSNGTVVIYNTDSEDTYYEPVEFVEEDFSY